MSDENNIIELIKKENITVIQIMRALEGLDDNLVVDLSSVFFLSRRYSTKPYNFTKVDIDGNPIKEKEYDNVYLLSQLQKIRKELEVCYAQLNELIYVMNGTTLKKDVKNNE